jgi:hypothetical protein
MSYKTSDVYRTAFLTVDGTLDTNNSQLYFRPLQNPKQPVSGHFYSLSPAQSTDPTIRINQFSSNGTLLDYGFLYDTQFNTPPPGSLLLVAGGIGSSIMIYSTDGVTWLASSNGSTIFSGGTCKAIAWNGFTWVAGGSSGAASKLAYSSNGLFWNRSTSGTSLLTNGCNAIITNGSLWVAGGVGLNRVIYGYDGINWYPSITANNLQNTSCLAGAWNGSVWVLGGSIDTSGSQSLIYSNDGISWFASNNGNTIFATCKTLAWNGSIWLAGGTPATGQINTLAYSYDGVDWKTISTTVNLRTSCNAVAWSGAQWIAGGTDPSNNTLIYSGDGITWITATNASSLFTSCNSVTWTGTLWIAGGAGTDSFINSYDGINWDPVTTAEALLTTCNAVAVNKVLPNAPITQHINTVIPSTPLMLLGGAAVNGIGSVISSSADGITWSPNPSANLIFAGSTCRALGWDGDQWVAGFSDGSAYLGNSYDGITWNANASASLYLTRGCYSVGTNGTLWLAGGAGTSRLIYSNDGYTWSASSQGNAVFADASCLTIAYNGSLWVAGSSSLSNRLAFSTDGSNSWTASSTGNALFPSSCNSVTWNGLLWIAVGDTIAYSSDGNNWTRAATIPLDTIWSSVAWNGLVWVVGGTGTNPLAYSYDGNVWLASPNGASIFNTNCTSVTWSGNLFLWVAAGNENNRAAYSFNGITWITSYNSTSIMRQSNTVAINRLLVNAGMTYPPPVLNPSPATAGKAVYSTGFNNLNVSSALTISDVQGAIGINKSPSSYVDQTGSIVVPTIDISGQGIWATTDADGTYPGVYLTNTDSANATSGYAGRILMQKSANGADLPWGWSIDSLWSPTADKNLQFVQWVNGQSNIAMNFNSQGWIGIGCRANVPPVAATFQMDISGATRVRDQLFVTRHTELNDLSASIIACSGSIASSLPIPSRGIIDASVNLLGVGNTLSNWTSIFTLTGTKTNYSTFLVSVNAVFDASNVNLSTNTTLDISVNGVTKYFLAGTSDTSGIPFTSKMFPLSYTFIVNAISNIITVSGYASSGVFVNTNIGGKYLTTVDIIGLT